MRQRRQFLATVINSIVLAALLAFIFGNSLFDRADSAQLSGGVLAMLQRVFPFLTEHIVRKLAHFCEFAALGFVTLHLCAVRQVVTGHFIAHSLFFGLATAVTDESLQMLSDRSAQVSDVLLDFCGFCSGAVIFLALLVLFRMWRRGRTDRQTS